MGDVYASFQGLLCCSPVLQPLLFEDYSDWPCCRWAWGAQSVMEKLCSQHTCSRIAWLLSTIRFGLFLNKNAAFLGSLLYLTCIKNGDFWETTFLWNPFLQCFVQNVNYCFLKWKSVSRKFILLHMINRDTQTREKWKHNQTGLLFLPGEQSGIKISLIWRWNIPVHIILQFYCNNKYRFAWELQEFTQENQQLCTTELKNIDTHTQNPHFDSRFSTKQL